MLPGAGALPFGGVDDKVSLLLYTLDESVPLGFDIITDSEEIIYVGENLTKKKIQLDSPNLSLRADDLPCFLYGLMEEDLAPTWAWSLINEVRSLLDIYNASGLGRPEYADELLNQALLDFAEGRYEEAALAMLGRRNETYIYAFDAVRPLVEAGFENPKESPYPIDILRELYLAERRYTRIDPDEVKDSEYLPGSLLTVRRGELLLIAGLNAFKEVNEGIFPLVLPFLLYIFYRRKSYEL
jgi:hypothetical protein